MGEVWRAEHRLLTRPAAIKLIRPDSDDAPGSRRHEEMRARFSREAQSTASMRSPHTIEVYDFGTAGDGTFYYVMELLEGFTMEALVERFGPLPAERVIHLMSQVCMSLGEAHEEGLIHRDIKPANVFVCRYGRQVDFVKVLDFGMVKTRSESMETQLTGEQAVLGTPAFMAPEQVLGNRVVDGRADLYAAGCLAYWLLTGQLVFTGSTAMEVMLQHAHEAPVPPSMRTELAIPPGLDDLVLACLAKDPAKRPASAEHLAEALASIPGASPWTTQAARDWWDRHQPRKTSVAR
jgi:serine/threonine-protein kinase